MPTIRFLGRVAPFAVNVSLGSIPYGISNHALLGFESKWELQIIDSNVTVIIEINKFDVDRDLQPVINHAQDIVGIAINLLSIKTGLALYGLLDRLRLPSGEMHFVHCKELEFPKHMTAVHQHSDLEQVLRIATSDHNIAMTLRDITDGLRQNYSGIIGAARAIDSICNYFIPEGGERKDGWPRMRAALNATEPYVQSISEQSKGPRHAKWSSASIANDQEARKTMERAWILMNRFLEYRKRGDHPLPASEFPLLDLVQA
jgi:hypothetical protein